MGLQPIFKQLYCFQWEQNRKRHRSVDADAWYKRALKYEQIVRDDELFKSSCIFLNCSNFTHFNSYWKNTIGANYILEKKNIAKRDFCKFGNFL